MSLKFLSLVFSQGHSAGFVNDIRISSIQSYWPIYSFYDLEIRCITG